MGSKTSTQTLPQPRMSDEMLEIMLIKGVLLFFAIILVYIPAMDGGYIYDDDQLLTINPIIQRGTGFTGSGIVAWAGILLVSHVRHAERRIIFRLPPACFGWNGEYSVIMSQTPRPRDARHRCAGLSYRQCGVACVLCSAALGRAGENFSAWAHGSRHSYGGFIRFAWNRWHGFQN